MSDTMRESFERWASDGGEWSGAVARDSDGNYQLMQTASAWNVWQAAAQSQQAQGEPAAVLCREIGETTWFDHQPLRPGSSTELARQKSPEWDTKPVYDIPPAPAALPKGWRLREKKTCYVLEDGSTVVATLAGPDAEENAVKIAAAISALSEPAAVPDGWRLVPIEPTPNMLKAAGKSENECAIHNYGGRPEADEYWSVMLGAAPAPAEPDQ